jgi:hypothetical protein
MRLIKKSDDAIVGIVAAFLIVGLVVIVLSMVQTQYVPKWMEEKEAEHMSQLADQFAQLKYAIDTHSSTKREDTPISTSITLGSKEMPYLMSVRAFGQLNILEKDFKITAINDSKSFAYSLGSIEYASANAYFIDQTYNYQCGAVILSQPKGNTVFIKPSFSVKYEKNVSITLNMINISTIGGKKSIAGYGTYPIQTEYLDFYQIPEIKDVSNIIIGTDYVNAWYSFINSTMIKSGLNYDGYGTNYSINTADENVFVEFKDTITVNLYINYIEIGAQIAPGWIENPKI